MSSQRIFSPKSFLRLSGHREGANPVRSSLSATLAVSVLLPVGGARGASRWVMKVEKHSDEQAVALTASR